jgi:trk system potassium uptake protein TrkH
MIALGYLLIIAIGTLLLSLPVSSRGVGTPSLSDALFTATSATCVTGLVVFDTFTQWSLFGQLVILLLIQIGGLGFMTIITMFSFFLRRRIGIKERGLLRESINVLNIGGIVRLIKKILIGTLFFEGLGAILLSIRFIPRMGVGVGIYNAVFHSVSAFCNAGFDLMGKYGRNSSLTTFSGDALVCLTITALIIVGGIGFFVWDDIYTNRHHIRKYQLHTKITLSVTAILIVLGTVGFFMFEKDNTLAGMPLGDQFVNALFCAVTPRTAGFNTVDVGALTPASHLLTVIFMFIGGSPGSTAGGIKTTTLAVIVIAAWASIRNTRYQNVFGRRLDDGALKRAVSVMAVNLSLLLIGALLIGAANDTLPVSKVMFEAASAIGTVGLSTGITSTLDTFSQMILAFLMYAGRVGSLSFALLFTEHRACSAVQSPVEKITIG